LIEETIFTISLQQLKRSEQLHFGSKIAANVGNIHIKQILRSESSLEAMEEYNMFCIIFGDVESSSPHSRPYTDTTNAIPTEATSTIFAHRPPAQSVRPETDKDARILPPPVMIVT
jgi:hypothetical protein